MASDDPTASERSEWLSNNSLRRVELGGESNENGIDI